MPIYEYRCGACGALHEALQKVSDPALTTCPSCGAEALRKKVSAAAFRLKGSGWYETDFKSGEKKNLAGDSAADSGDKKVDAGDSKKSEKTESKPTTESAATAKTSSGTSSGKKDA